LWGLDGRAVLLEDVDSGPSPGRPVTCQQGTFFCPPLWLPSFGFRCCVIYITIYSHSARHCPFYLAVIELLAVDGTFVAPLGPPGIPPEHKHS